MGVIWVAEEYPTIFLLFIPAGCTGWLQPLDLTFNLAFKRLLKQAAGMWLASTMQEQISQVRDPSLVKLNLELNYLKPFFCGWLASSLAKMASNKDVILRGWNESGMGLALSLAQDANGTFNRTSPEFVEAARLQAAGELSKALSGKKGGASLDRSLQVSFDDLFAAEAVETQAEQEGVRPDAPEPALQAIDQQEMFGSLAGQGNQYSQENFNAGFVWHNAGPALVE